MLIHLESAPVEEALFTFATLAQKDLLYVAPLPDIRTHSVRCFCTPEQTIALMLEDRVLEIRWKGDELVVVTVMERCRPASNPLRPCQPQNSLHEKAIPRRR